MTKWTRERPTVPGPYWFKSDKEEDGVFIVMVAEENGRLVVYEFGMEAGWKLTVYETGRWWGPLEEPE